MAEEPTPSGNPFPCPSCGTRLAAGTVVCTHCGADGRTGWGEDSKLDLLVAPPESESNVEEPAVDPRPPGFFESGGAVHIAVALLILSLLFFLFFAPGEMDPFHP